MVTARARAPAMARVGGPAAGWGARRRGDLLRRSATRGADASKPLRAGKGGCSGIRTEEMKVLRDRKADIGISANPKREPVLSYFANEEALGFELVSGAVSEHTGLQNVVLGDVSPDAKTYRLRGGSGSPVNVARVI